MLPLPHLTESLHDPGIEMGPALGNDFPISGLNVQTGPVRPVAGQGIIDVGDRHNPGVQRELLTSKAVGVALPVPPLVVMANNTALLVQVAQTAEEFLHGR